MSNQKKRGCLFYVVIVLLIDIGLGVAASVVASVGEYVLNLDEKTKWTVGMIVGGILLLTATIVILVKIRQHKKRKIQERLRMEHERELRNAKEIKQLISHPYSKISSNKKNVYLFHLTSDYISHDLQKKYMDVLEDALAGNAYLLAENEFTGDRGES